MNYPDIYLIKGVVLPKQTLYTLTNITKSFVDKCDNNIAKSRRQMRQNKRKSCYKLSLLVLT